MGEGGSWRGGDTEAGDTSPPQNLLGRSSLRNYADECDALQCVLREAAQLGLWAFTLRRGETLESRRQLRHGEIDMLRLDYVRQDQCGVKTPGQAGRLANHFFRFGRRIHRHQDRGDRERSHEFAPA